MRSPIVPSLRAKRNALRPWVDPAFLIWCRRQGISTGLFYADAWYRTDHFRGQRAVAGPKSDAPALQVGLVALSLFCGSPFPANAASGGAPALDLACRASEHLWPGCPTPSITRPAVNADGLRLFYVGGIVPPVYDLKPMVEAVSQLPGVSLTLCCRAEEWAKKGSYYGTLDPARVQIIHESGERLAAHTRQPMCSACSTATRTWAWRCQ